MTWSQHGRAPLISSEQFLWCSINGGCSPSELTHEREKEKPDLQAASNALPRMQSTTFHPHSFSKAKVVRKWGSIGEHNKAVINPILILSFSLGRGEPQKENSAAFGQDTYSMSSSSLVRRENTEDQSRSAGTFCSEYNPVRGWGGGCFCFLRQSSVLKSKIGTGFPLYALSSKKEIQLAAWTRQA